MSASAKLVIVLLPLVLVAEGCVEEDTITISRDGVVKFNSVMTEADEAKAVTFPQVEAYVSKVVAELEQAQWKVEQQWISKERPYRFRLSGSGSLSEVAPGTRFYVVMPLTGGLYRVWFPTESGKILRRVAFTSGARGETAEVRDTKGAVVTAIDRAVQGDPYTIMLHHQPSAG